MKISEEIRILGLRYAKLPLMGKSNNNNNNNVFTESIYFQTQPLKQSLVYENQAIMLTHFLNECFMYFWLLSEVPEVGS